MNSVARLASEERRLLFDQTAAATGLAPWVVEKDFWVCWILRELFSGVGDSPRLLFKGGTSLSKVFGLIHSFPRTSTSRLIVRISDSSKKEIPRA